MECCQGHSLPLGVFGEAALLSHNERQVGITEFGLGLVLLGVWGCWGPECQNLGSLAQTDFCDSFGGPQSSTAVSKDV